MKKLIAAVIAASFTTVAFAQATPAPAKKADEKKAAPAKKDEKKAAAPATPATPATPAKK